ncbi:unnamed protein product, partial [Brassica rapa]
MICKIGNSETASFWFDVWTPKEPLIKAIGSDGPRRLRISITASVKDACNNNIWNLPSPRSDQEITLHAFLTTIDTPTEGMVTDEYFW